jgi:ribosomal protein S13
MKKVKDISEDEQKKISDELQKYVLESDLKREICFCDQKTKRN